MAEEAEVRPQEVEEPAGDSVATGEEVRPSESAGADVAPDGVALDPERQSKAREYARIRRKWTLVDVVLTLALILLFWLSGGSEILKEQLVTWGLTQPWLLTGAYFLILIVAGTLIFLPMSWWTGFVLPHRYDLSTQSLDAWLIDQAKGLGLEILLGVPVIEVIYALLRGQPDTWWIWGAAFVVLLGVVLGAAAPYIIVPLFYDLKPLDDEELVERVRSLARKTDTRIAEVNTIDLSRRTTAANAMVMGLGSTKRIALGDTLYEDYTIDEIASILAHELGHQVHHDLALGILVQSAFTFSSFYAAHLTLQWSVARFGFDGIADLAAVPLVALVGFVFSLITLPLVNAYSRWRERMADRFALNVIEEPQAFKTAMTRLSNQNLAEVDPPAWVVWLLYDHPPIRERLEMVDRAAA
jgi:STE24 endopeptidase